MLQIKNLTKIYDGGVKALDDVSFEVPEGQFLAVIGLSGSGKSTLLRCINRLVEPTSGQIIWNGVDITAASQEEMRIIRRKIGMVFQHFNLVHRSNVITNVLAGRLGYVNPAWSLLNRFPKEDVEKAIKQLTRVGIADKANQRGSQTSFRIGSLRVAIKANTPNPSVRNFDANLIGQRSQQRERLSGLSVLQEGLDPGGVLIHQGRQLVGKRIYVRPVELG